MVQFDRFQEARMSDVLVSLIVFVGTCVAALVGFWVQRRLPESHQNDATKSSVRLTIGMMATLTSILLGMVTASAKETYDAGNAVITSMAVDILMLDQILDNYGAESASARQQLRDSLHYRIETIEAGDAYFIADQTAVKGISMMERLYNTIHSLAPTNELQRDLRSRALEILGGRVSYGDGNLAQQRWFFTVKPASIPQVFLVVVFGWLVLEFFCFGIFSTRNATVLTTIAVGSLIVASAVFLILELENPMSGFLRVPTESLRLAEQLLTK